MNTSAKFHGALSIDSLSSWFGDSMVTKNITGEAGRSFVAAIKASGTNLHQAVLSHAARRMATHLFIEIEFLKRHFLAATCFLRVYLARVRFPHEVCHRLPN